ncbi:MAG: hypothetical protein ABSF59_21215 [Candidatus Sulfotelmatobacter sp.]|jgi:hypothetical protein
MKLPLEYHSNVRQSIPASLALLGMLFLPLLCPAQANSAANSASSGGHSFSPSAPAMSSAVHSFASANSAPSFSTNATHSVPNSPHSIGGSNNPPHHNPVHRGSNPGSGGGVVYYPYLYAVPVPYAADDADAYNTDTPDDDNDDAEYQGGPTIFDRRGSGPDSYVPPVSEPIAQNRNDQDISANISANLAAAEPPQVSTTLVFKDGHQIEIANYAIVSQTLFDLTPGHPRKIALADLDLPATEKQNDDRGVTFQLPPTAQAN